MTPELKRWIDALKTLAVDREARVRCPERDDGWLTVIDVPCYGDTKIERYMTCDSCGARNVALMAAPKPPKT